MNSNLFVAMEVNSLDFAQIRMDRDKRTVDT
ncbi:hypothetical protein M2110_002363 [Paenibacillus sp. PastF-4]|nr:hypothetical protein [Paenibacillus sp. PastF-4]